MANSSCPVPFIAELDIGDTGGYLAGRWCTPHVIDNDTISCCFPCPFTDWQYSTGFHENVVPWIALVVLILMFIAALTFILLPVEDTLRHYLTSSPLMGFIFMSIAFIVPLGTKDHFCHDPITPNNFLSDTTCAFTGSLILFGVWVLVIGCFFRSLFLFLQLICDLEPGKWFRAISLACIFGGSLALLGVALGVSGVSYQVGNMCYISYPHSVGSFWGPLIGVALVSFLIQIFIMGYCIRGVVTRGGTARISFFKRSDNSDLSPGVVAVPARHTSRKIGQILRLQWRAIAIACLILLYVVYVAQAVLRWGDPGKYSPEDLQPWVDCLVDAKGDKKACSDEAKKIGVNQEMAVSALALLASCGIWGVICTARYTMILGWIDWFWDRVDYFSSLCKPEREDVEQPSTDGDRRSLTVESPATLEDVDRIYGARTYHCPQNSFSRPGRARTNTSPGSIYAGSSAANSTFTTTIESANAVEFKEFK
ncbi:hypothetical protein BDV18DRAFT_398 [Aspergillus unguis]